MPPSFSFVQPVLSGGLPKLSRRVQFSSLKLSSLNDDTLSQIKDSNVVGIAPGYSKKGKLIGLALCTDSKGLILELDGRKQAGSKTTKARRSSEDSESPSDASDSSPPTTATHDARQLLEDTILCRDSPDFALAAFDFGPMAFALHSDAELRVHNGFDVQALFPGDDSISDRRPTSAVQKALQSAHLDRVKALNQRIETDFLNAEFSLGEIIHMKELACRAWLAYFLVSECADAKAMEEYKRISTKDMTPNVRNRRSAPGHFCCRLMHGA
jgi:hypothetical protein